MKKIVSTLSSLFVISVSGIAQEHQHDFQVETQGGYEYNYFRSPDEVLFEGVLLTRDSLIRSSSYQDLTLDYKYKYKWKRDRLRVSAKPEARFFYDQTDDSYWSLDTRIKYDHKFSKNTALLAETVFKRMAREGLGGAQDVLINPLGYTLYGASIGALFGIVPKNETKLEAFYNFKDFDAFGIRDLQYDEFGIQFKTEQDHRVRGKTHTYGLSGYIKKRLYDTFNASEVVSDGVRDWSYWKTSVYYEFPFGEKLELEPSFTYYQRIDNAEDRSGFRQYGPKLKVVFDNDRTRIRASAEYLMRSYASFEARDNTGPIGENIRYGYADLSLKAEHQVSDNLFLTATAFSRVRQTNYSDINARSFRGYRNQYAGLGIKYAF